MKQRLVGRRVTSSKMAAAKRRQGVLSQVNSNNEYVACLWAEGKQIKDPEI